MIKSETKIRVRYGETDQMGYVYYGVYAQYYEVGRVDAMRSLGFSYKDVEERGILMPVIDFSISYKKPAFYDDEITVVTYMKERPSGLRLVFDYECFNAAGELLNTGKVTLVLIDKATNKMCKIPDWFQNGFNPFF
ncbi:MAG: thioesterase family protein [Bacteroidota bacterium]|nr:thioesterase family protein [Bacteroidota bacterium]MDP3145043.1 thioesterase family protein [Bacteroidota bacterium]MDP3556075.1 thioesterase family protein [Bacteroidota bacterium]